MISNFVNFKEKAYESRRKGIERRKLELKSKIDTTNPETIFLIALYEAEGNKKEFAISNMDYKIHLLFLKFLKTTFPDFESIFYLNIHESREQDLSVILAFWTEKLNVEKSEILVYINRRANKAKGKTNTDYYGVLKHRIRGKGSSLLAIVFHSLFEELYSKFMGMYLNC